ncbi:metal ABC transporter ATP-binding protein [Scatolibacter rhodanostii]|uniref:metal ABC transporter ATP-binding protein n=1 Tax=Scatolibacter rhodanostii TaxID=2014781 RepID=UPI000C0762C8|nr:metal ABC transporter ATP-binding protein [Scatolibacter rhodanostii]
MPLITCRDVSFAYEGNTVVEELNFSVDSGDYLCVVGENGSGKSTLIKGLLGLKSPSKGKISMDENLKSNEIGYLPQQTAAQKDFPASAYEIVISGRLSTRGIRPFYTKEDKQIVEKNIALLGIDNLRNRCYRELSGGQQQRVLLARALCATKKLLLLDEPTAGLDPMVTVELYNQIEHINKETGLTIIMVSHDIESSLKYSSHILQLKKQQLFFGTTDDYKQSDEVNRFWEVSR